jgi:hypothetical protein
MNTPGTLIFVAILLCPSWAIGGVDRPSAFVKPSLAGTVVAVSADGKTLTIETPPPKKGESSVQYTVKLTTSSRLSYENVPPNGKKPTIGYQAVVWLVKGSKDTADQVRFTLKQVILLGIVKSTSSDGTSIDLQRSSGKNGELEIIRLRIGNAKISFHGIERTKRPPAGSFARAWLRPGSSDIASGVAFGRTKTDVVSGEGKVPSGTNKPGPKKKGKPPAETIVKNTGKKPRPPALARVVHPDRSSATITAFIDNELDQRLKKERIPASPQADDSEFLRRVTLDLTGRVPT